MHGIEVEEPRNKVWSTNKDIVNVPILLNIIREPIETLQEVSDVNMLLAISAKKHKVAHRKGDGILVIRSILVKLPHNVVMYIYGGWNKELVEKVPELQDVRIHGVIDRIRINWSLLHLIHHFFSHATLAEVPSGLLSEVFFATAAAAALIRTRIAFCKFSSGTTTGTIEAPTVKPILARIEAHLFILFAPQLL
jgi:hypothetical protein